MPPKRQPRPWVKLHRAPIQGPEWGELGSDTARAVWIECLTLARDDNFSGDLPTVAQIAWRFHRPEEQVLDAVELLTRKEWLEKTSAGLRCPNWRAWQGYTSTERSQDARDRAEAERNATQCNAMQREVSDCSNTDAETETETDSEAEKEEERTAPLSSGCHPTTATGNGFDVSALGKNIVETWNRTWDEYAGQQGIRIQNAAPMSKALLAQLAKRCKERSSRKEAAHWQDLIGRMTRIAFLSGRSKGDWRPTLPWLVSHPTRLVKLEDGAYGEDQQDTSIFDLDHDPRGVLHD